MKRLNYQLLLFDLLPIFLLLSIILWLTLRTEGVFGGFIAGFKFLLFSTVSIVLIIITLVKNVRRIRKNQQVKEAKIILTVLAMATVIGINSTWFPYYFFDPSPQLVASNRYGNQLKLFEEDYLLVTKEIPFTVVERGTYQFNTDTLILTAHDALEPTHQYLKRDLVLMPILPQPKYLAQDSVRFLTIMLVD